MHGVTSKGFGEKPMDVDQASEQSGQSSRIKARKSREADLLIKNLVVRLKIPNQSRFSLGERFRICREGVAAAQETLEASLAMGLSEKESAERAMQAASNAVETATVASEFEGLMIGGAGLPEAENFPPDGA